MARGDHVHQLPDGSFTGASDRDGQHQHTLPDGTTTPMDVEGPDHTHLGTVGLPVPTMNESLSNPLFKIPSVPIFQVGTWNGDIYTEGDLDEMVRAFEENSQTLRPFLKLGHNRDQKLLAKDGLPAAGWIDSLRREGGTLLADFVDVPRKIYDLITKKAYRNVSAEIYWNTDLNGKFYKRLLSAVSLLGADMPALNSLDDILSLYGLKNSDSIKTYTPEVEAEEIKAYNFDKEFEMAEKTEKEKQLEKDLAGLRSELEATKKNFSQTEEKLKEREGDAEKLQNRIAALETERREDEVKNYCLELENEDLLTPAAKPLVEFIVSGKKEFSTGEGESEKKYTTKSALREVLKIAKEAEKVNYTQETETGKSVEVDREEKIIKAAKEYAAKNDVSFGDAARIVRKDMNDE